MSTVYEAAYRRPGTEFISFAELIQELQGLEHIKSERAYANAVGSGQVVVETAGSLGLSAPEEGPYSDAYQRLEKIIVMPGVEDTDTIFGLVRTWNGSDAHQYLLAEFAHDDTHARIECVLEPGIPYVISDSPSDPDVADWETMFYLDANAEQVAIAHKGKGETEVLGALSSEYQNKSPLHPELWATSFDASA